MPEIKEWWLHVTDYGPEVGEPAPQAYSPGNAERFNSLGEAINATADIPSGKYAWISGGGIFYDPNQIKPLRKLRYRPGDE